MSYKDWKQVSYEWGERDDALHEFIFSTNADLYFSFSSFFYFNVLRRFYSTATRFLL